RNVEPMSISFQISDPANQDFTGKLIDASHGKVSQRYVVQLDSAQRQARVPHVVVALSDLQFHVDLRLGDDDWFVPATFGCFP
ncbi:hypothetical protein, partial [Escherichia coli]|uniref:hypothetical protein n=1 Tax=Escherichia coli TaxID=562 RepID=UPI001AEBF9C2